MSFFERSYEKTVDLFKDLFDPKAEFLAFPEHTIVMLLVIGGIVLSYFLLSKSDKFIRQWFRKGEFRFHEPYLKFFLRIIGLALIFFAILGPYWGRTEQQVKVLGKEVYIVVDVSASMNTEDVKPNRLSKMKKDLKDMVYQLRGERVGIIVFADHAYLQCPLTHDYAALKMFIDLISTDQFESSGTDIRDGLGMALERFTEGERPDMPRSISRGIVLISDGEDFGEKYISVVDRLKKKNIHVFPVGIGTHQGGPVPDILYGKQRGFKKDKHGKTAVSRLNEETLRNLALEFKTQYHLIDDAADNLEPVTEQVKLMTASTIDTKMEQVRNNHYQIFLICGLAILLFSMMVLPVRKARKVVQEEETEPIGKKSGDESK